MSTLGDKLETHITDQLKVYQQGDGRQDVKDTLIDLINLDEPPYVAMNHALARMKTVHKEIRDARDAGNCADWVSPRLTAVAFEGIFESSVGIWLAAGPPKDPLTLQPSVLRFVKWQIGMLAASIRAK